MKYNFETVSKDKCDKKAVKFRKSGNIKYQGGKLTLALVDYNKSITFAISKEVISLGYANRSAVYFELKRYKDCMKNIEWALESNYPENKIANLIDRKERCEKLIQSENHEDLSDFFKLSYPPNKKIPWIVDCVTARLSLQYGLGIYATKDLKAGDMISFEEPIAPCLAGKSLYGRCYNCGKAAFLNLIPCDKTATSMFCSPKCKNKSYEKAAEIQDNIDGTTRVMEELVFLANGKENLMDMIENTNWDDPKMKKSVFDYDWTDSNDLKRKENILKCCLSMKKNWAAECFEPDAAFNNVVKRNYSAPPKIISIGIQLFLGANIHSSDIVDELEIGHYIATTLFTNLINHSCTPNAIAFPVDNKIVTVLLTPVKKFEQIFLSHSMEKFMHVDTKTCQICDYKPTIDAAPIILIRDKNFTVLKSWINHALESINNSAIKYSHLDPLPATFSAVIFMLGMLCTFPQ